MHYHYIEDSRGDLVDLVPFCCDNCHRAWCERNDAAYGGWNGCQESAEYVEFCANCGVAAGGYECDCQRDNVVVNRFLSRDGERCKHGNWIQLPISMMESDHE